MKTSDSSAPVPAERPVRPVVETVLAAANVINKTQAGSAAMVREAAHQIQQTEATKNTSSQL
ncbi:MAG: hypothetical protein F6K00_29930 [Leptolyngbya sp. SIOISBB]|nr:hypothetical protein [Leptolyngbya sp. SIOISBB]